MPTLTNPNRGSSYSAPRYKAPRVTLGTPGSGADRNVGKFQFGLEQKPEEVISAAGSLAQAAVGFTAGVAQSIPVIGKPISMAAGGVATGISEIGFEGGPKIKDLANIPLKALEGAGNLALDALGFLGDVVERGVAQGRVMTSGGDSFKNLPVDVKTAMNRGDYAQAGDLLFKSGTTYGTGIQALVLDFALDPLTYVPGAVVSKVVTTPFKAAASAAKFGIGATKAQKNVKLAHESGQRVIRNAFDTKELDRRIEVASGLMKAGPDGKTLAVGKQNVLDNINSTMSATVGSAAQSRYATESFIGAQEIANSIIDKIAMTIGPKIGSPAREAAALPQLRRAMEAVFPDSPEYVEEVIRKLRIGISDDEINAIKKTTALKLQNQNAKREIAERGASNILKVKVDTIAKELEEAAAKVIRDSMQDLDYLIKSTDEAERLVSSWISDGLNISIDAAKPLIDDIMSSVKGGNRQAALEALEFARQQGFGSYRRQMIALRNSAADFPEDIRDLVSRLTIASQRSLDDAVEARLKAELESATPDAVQGILRTYINKYDELYARFGPTPDDELVASKVLNYIKDSNVKITRIPDGLISKMPSAVQSMAAKLKAAGYEISLAPEQGFREVIDVAPSLDGLDTVAQLVTPFADLTDDFAVRTALNASGSAATRQSAMMRRFDVLTSSPSTQNILQRSYERFALTGVNSGLSRGESRDLWVALNNYARSQEVSLRGAIGMQAIRFGKSSIDEVARGTIGKEAYDRLARAGGAYDDRAALKMLLKSLNGDLSQIGFAPKVSAKVKDIFPKIMVVTDYMYPLVRFGVLNPFFRYVQENIEPEFFRILRGAYKSKRDLILDETKSTIIARAMVSNRSVIREFGDAQVSMTRANLYATAAVATRNKGYLERVQEWAKVNKSSFFDVGGRKRSSFNEIVPREAAINFTKDMSANSPRLFEELTRFYNTADPHEIGYQLSLDIALRDDPLAAIKYMDDLTGQAIATRLANASPEMKNAYYNAVEAYKYAYFKGAKTARRSIYYEDEVPYWVRSLNHPFLLIYPLSYMVTKVIPEFAQALFTRVPFVGAERIGVGYNAYENISEQLIMEMEYGDGFLLKFFKDNPDFAYFINMLFPGIPSQLGFSVPANIRSNIIKPGLEGEGVDIFGLMDGVRDQIWRGSIGGQGSAALRGILEATGVDLDLKIPFIGDIPQEPSDAIEIKN